MDNLLNPYQKNSLRISLMMFEENLNRAREWLDGRKEKGILYERQLSIPEEKRQQAKQSIEMASDLIQDLAVMFELGIETEDASSILQGELSVSWANLLDTQAGKLRRYGAVHPDLSGILDTKIQNLAGIAFQLSSILGQTKQEKP
jgi:hypothetical protein